MSKQFADPHKMVTELLQPGEHLHFASTPSRPNALARAVADVWQGRAVFTISSNALHASMHYLTLSRVVNRAIIAFAGDTIPISRSSSLYKQAPAGVPFPVEEWTLLSLAQRLKAAAEGHDWVSSRSLANTDLLTPLLANGVARQTRVSSVVQISALKPDIVLLHAGARSSAGDFLIAGPKGEADWGVRAARRGVIATVEPHIPCKSPEHKWLKIPATRVLSWAVVPYGAHPQGMAPMNTAGVTGYLDDYAYLAELCRHMETEDKALEWYMKWVKGISHLDYLSKLGTKKMRDLELPGSHAIRPRPLKPHSRPNSDNSIFDISLKQRTILLASKAIRQMVREHNISMLLGGLGLSHLAAWHASLIGAAEGLDLCLADEMGNWNYTPYQGDTFLFSQRHVSRGRMHLSTMEVLRNQLEKPDTACHAMAVLSAAQIDEFGNLNSSRTSDGSFLVGSGGASDIATRIRTLAVLQAAPGQICDRVNFITSPGKNVRDLVTPFGWARRDNSSWFLMLAPNPRFKPVISVASLPKWWPKSIPQSHWQPTQHEITCLRNLDPEGVYR